MTNLFVSTPQRTFREFYDSLFIKWGQANPYDLVANNEHMKAPWDPNECDIADVIKQIWDGALWHYVGQIFNDKRLVFTWQVSSLMSVCIYLHKWWQTQKRTSFVIFGGNWYGKAQQNTTSLPH